jgi:hypothetical protein
MNVVDDPLRGDRRAFIRREATHRLPGRPGHTVSPDVRPAAGDRRGPSDIRLSCTGLRRPKLAGLLDFKENRLATILPASCNATIARAGITRSRQIRHGLRAAGIKTAVVDEIEIVGPDRWRRWPGGDRCRGLGGANRRGDNRVFECPTQDRLIHTNATECNARESIYPASDAYLASSLISENRGLLSGFFSLLNPRT